MTKKKSINSKKKAFSLLTKKVLKEREREIPIYDPQTGEPNPEYERLTGKKNPLLISTEKPISLTEPKLKNRFLIRFSENFGFKDWTFTKTNRPIITNTGNRFVWNEINLILYDTINPSASECVMKLIENNKPFDYFMDILDPTGVVIEKWKICGCVITYVNFGELDYSNNSLAEISMIIKPTSIKLVDLNNK